MAQIDNLRMATKYSFHIRPQSRQRIQRIQGRSGSFDNEIENDILGGGSLAGHTIIIPTKGCKL